MRTPGQPERGLIPPLYGESGCVINHGISAISRRGLMAGALALPVAARAGAVAAPDALLEAALAWMGGRELLMRVKALSWIENHHIPMGGRVRIEPFGVTRTIPWQFNRGEGPLVSWGPAVDHPPASPAPSSPFERYVVQHYALYSHMLLLHSIVHRRGRHLVSEHPGYRRATFAYGRDGRPARARHDIANAEGRRVTRLIAFDGEVRDQGIRWPRNISIREGGYPPDTTSITEFKAELN